MRRAWCDVLLVGSETDDQGSRRNLGVLMAIALVAWQLLGASVVKVIYEDTAYRCDHQPRRLQFAVLAPVARPARRPAGPQSSDQFVR
jgi:hypothetical protein